MSEKCKRPRPGRQLATFFGMFLVNADRECLCHDRAKLMDIMGCQWCRDHLDTIVGWLEEEAHCRNMPFSRAIAKRMVLYAIRRAERGK